MESLRIRRADVSSAALRGRDPALFSNDVRYDRRCGDGALNRNADPRRIVAVLGASNVSLALPEILGAFHRRLAGSGPTDYYVAHGPGRSYGIVAGVAFVKFSPLTTCGLHDALEARWRSAGRPPVHALLTDVGNDVMYGATAGRIASWVREIAERFGAFDARVALTSVPVESVHRIPAWKYSIVRPILYPPYPLCRRDVFTRVVQVQDELEALGRRLPVEILPTRAEWYSFDGIHVARRERRHVFGRWVDALLYGADAPSRPGGENEARLTIPPAKLRLSRPAELFIAGHALRREQTGIEVGEGARLYLY